MTITIIVVTTCVTLVLGEFFLAGMIYGEHRAKIKSDDAYFKVSLAYEKEKIEHHKLKRMLGADDTYRTSALIDIHPAVEESVYGKRQRSNSTTFESASDQSRC